MRLPCCTTASRLSLLFLSGALALSAGCAADGDPTLSSDDGAAIRNGIESIVTAANHADWTGWTAVYADDAVIMPPNSPPIMGRTALQELLAALPPTSDWALDVIDLDGRGDLAFVRGAYRFRMLLPGSEAPIADDGSFMHIWRQQADNSWKVEREIFHSDNPPPTP